MTSKLLTIIIGFSLLGSGCVTESQKTLATTTVVSHNKDYRGKRHPLVIGKFNNSSSYNNGVFSSNIDRLGNQAKTILITHLQMSKRFDVLDRGNMKENAQEAKLAGIQQKIKGADILVTGNVTEFGRKTIGDRQFFGIFGGGKTQIAYAKVMLNVIDVKNSSMIHSVQAAGEFELSNREIMGFGSSAGYDATLNGKVLNLAIRDAVDKLVADLEVNKWSL